MLRLRLLMFLLLCTLAVAAPAQARTSPEQVDPGDRVASFAERFVGVRYAWGGWSPRTGFDCSGLVYFVYRHFGVRLPRATYDQFRRGRRVPRGALRPGDLVFFAGLSHVGLYVGHGRFIHAPHTGTRVRVERLTGWYRATFAGARRLRLY